MDSIPLVCLTGQVPTSLIGSDAFQECDTVDHHAAMHQAQLAGEGRQRTAATIHEAFHVAATGRPGPVVVGIPKDVQFARGTCKPAPLAHHDDYQPKVQGDLENQGGGRADGVGEEADHLFRWRVVNAGPEASQLLRELVELTGFPITSTLMGLGAYPASGRTGSACWACMAHTRPT